jgi:hypothetical protein
VLRVFFAVPLLVVLGGWLLFSAASALRRGEANAAGTRVKYRGRPACFVLTVAVQFAFGILALFDAGTILYSVIHGG